MLIFVRWLGDQLAALWTSDEAVTPITDNVVGALEKAREYLYLTRPTARGCAPTRRHAAGVGHASVAQAGSRPVRARAVVLQRQQ